jgi:hypothetical protein
VRDFDITGAEPRVPVRYVPGEGFSNGRVQPAG